MWEIQTGLKHKDHQGRHGEFEPGKDQYYRVGLICPPGWDRVKVSQNLGKDQSFPAFPAVAALK